MNEKIKSYVFYNLFVLALCGLAYKASTMESVRAKYGELIDLFVIFMLIMFVVSVIVSIREILKKDDEVG